MKKEQLSLMTFPLDVDVMYRKMTILECLKLAKSAEIGLVDVMNVSDEALPAYLDAMNETGVKVNCYIGLVSFFSSEEKEIIEAIRTYLRTADLIGAQLLTLVPVNVKEDEIICTGLGKAGIRKRLVSFFSEAVSMAQNFAVKVSFETTPQDYTCLSGIEDCRWILEQVPGLGLVYDTANMLPHGDDPIDYYERLKKHIVHVHLKDVRLSESASRHTYEQTKDGLTMNCCVSGEGVIPIREIIAHLDHDGYNGTVALEYCHPNEYPAGPSQHEQQLRRHLDYLKSSPQLFVS